MRSLISSETLSALSQLLSSSLDLDPPWSKRYFRHSYCHSLVLCLVVLIAVPASACDRIVLSGATVGQAEKMGTYTKSGQINYGRPVFQNGSNYLYYYDPGYGPAQWNIGSNLNNTNNSLISFSTAASPELVGSFWKVSNHSKSVGGRCADSEFISDPNITAKCSGPTVAPPRAPTPANTTTDSPEVQFLFDNINSCTSPCLFNFTQDADWGGRELQITRSNVHITLQGVQAKRRVTFDAKHQSRFILALEKHHITLRFVNLRLINGSPSMSAEMGNGNHKAYGGAIYVSCFDTAGFCSVELERVVLAHNRLYATTATAGDVCLSATTATAGDVFAVGGAIFVVTENGGGITLNQSTIYNNTAFATSSACSNHVNVESSGGAINLYSLTGGSLTVIDSIISANVASSDNPGQAALAHGGGLYCDCVAPTTLTNTLFENNQVYATGNYAYATGGAVRIRKGEVRIHQFNFTTDADTLTSDKSTVLSCNEGYYNRKLTSAIAIQGCTACEPGRFLNSSITGLCSRCQACPQGRYGNNSRARVALETYCVQCNRGKYSNMVGAISCTDCSAGFYGASEGSTDPQCSGRCPDGTKCPSGVGSPTLVLPGREYSAVGGTLVEAGCPVGTYCLDGVKNSCPSGKYQDEEGQAYCKPLKPNQLLKPVSLAKASAAQMMPWSCPQTGMTCIDGNRSYDGGIWHNPLNPYPSAKQIYTCVNDGCPQKGATEMNCQEGYVANSPLCAVCTEGYYKQLRRCQRCEQPQIGALIGVSFGVIAALAALFYFVQRHGHYFNGLLPYCKIWISFITVASTCETQFGIQWPEQLLSFFAILSTVTFDLSAITNRFCLVRISFYTTMIFTTSALAIVVLVIEFVSRRSVHDDSKQLCRRVSTYLLLFAYPLVSVKIVGIFGCHEVDGQSYLRADYSTLCYDGRWRLMAVYAWICLVVYVIGMPVFIIAKLYRYYHNSTNKTEDGAMSYVPRDLALGFLLDDYKLVLPCLLWEGCEMMRKLLLSVIGSFWGDKSPMAVATALLISVIFLILQHHYQPYEAPICSSLQSACLSVLSLLYFVGLLVKVNTVEEQDSESLGKLIIALFVMVVFVPFWVIIAAVFLRQRRMVQQAKKANFGVKVVTVTCSQWISGSDILEHELFSTGALIAFVLESSEVNMSSAKLQKFQAQADEKYMDVVSQFMFTESVGNKFRIIGLLGTCGPLPVVTRGITISQLRQFHVEFPGQTSRDKQGQLKRECPSGKGYVEWKIGKQQHPQAMVSYCWEMNWEPMIQYLSEKFGEEGIVWIDLLACDQNAIAEGDMSEIELLPLVIDYVGATVVMPGTLSRLWCLFEMSYALVHNSQFAYYQPTSLIAADPSIHRLLAQDRDQLQLAPGAMLKAARCYKESDRDFILRLMDTHFKSRDDAANVIKLFASGQEDLDLHRHAATGGATGANPAKHQATTKNPMVDNRAATDEPASQPVI